MNLERDYYIKTLLLGDSGVGKSCLLRRIGEKKYDEDMCAPTIGVDYKKISIKAQNNIVKFLIWDTAGQERFQSISRIYYKNAQITIFIFDLTNRQSFNRIKFWLNEFEMESHIKTIKILVGNKYDLNDKKITDDEIKNMIENNFFINYFEISVRNNTQIDNMFEFLSNLIISEGDLYKTTNPHKKINLENKKKNNYLYKYFSC